MARARKTPNAVSGRLADMGSTLQNGAEPQTPHGAAVEDAKPEPDAAATASTGRQRVTIAEPGTRQGLRSGWTRATVIVRDDVLETLKNYAYTERRTLKDVLDEALQAYVDGIDKSKLLQRK